MKNFVCTLIFFLAIITATHAAYVCPRVVDDDTDGLLGFATIEIFVQTSPGESFRGIDVSITGPMNQVQAAGNPTPFGNFNAFIPDDFHKDSQFLFLGNEPGLLSIDVSEDGNSLKGAISGLANLDPPLTNPVPIARLVINLPTDPLNPLPFGHDIHLDIAVDIGLPEPHRVNAFLHELCFPEPTTLMLTSLGLVLLCGFRRR